MGRLVISHSGTEARAHVGLGSRGTMDGPYSQGYDYDVWGNVTHKYGWGGEVQGGGAGQSSDIYYSYTSNRRNGFSYDAAGNLTNDLGQNFTYDVTGQQTNASYSGYSLVQSYDGDGLRVKKNDNGAVTYYLRSSVLGGQVVAELNGGAVWMRGYVYLGSQLLAVQDSGVYWMHEDPVTKSKRVTNSTGAVISTIELDPWGADTSRSSNAAFQPHRFTSYERDANGTDEAMFRRYNRWQSRFDQPDPSDGSYDLSDPQSFNRYAYVQGDPVNFVDPSGLLPILVCGYTWANPELGYVYNCSIREVPEPSDPRDPPGGGGKGDRPPTNPEGKTNANPQNLCDQKLAGIFGGPGAVADTGRTPGTLLHPGAGTQRFPDHSAEGGVMHLYTNAQGTAATVGLYVPSGFTAVPGGSGTKYFPDKPGQVNAGQVNYNYSQYRNSAGITISFVHIGAPTGPGRNDAGSTRVGSIAGPGGDAYGYNHTHINFYSNFATGTRVDPRKLFCKDFGF